mmetsp:Transcript_2097/g.6399  ORF Transcript_2097/g.6399 Transcript_2097/m.6399 type:complete len:214 (-) Transcript_2097:22-663(-)
MFSLTRAKSFALERISRPRSPKSSSNAFCLSSFVLCFMKTCVAFVMPAALHIRPSFATVSSFGPSRLFVFVVVFFFFQPFSSSSSSWVFLSRRCLSVSACRRPRFRTPSLSLSLFFALVETPRVTFGFWILRIISLRYGKRSHRARCVSRGVLTDPTSIDRAREERKREHHHRRAQSFFVRMNEPHPGAIDHPESTQPDRCERAALLEEDGRL